MSDSTLIRTKDFAAIGFVWAVPAAILAPTLAGTRVFFSNDITHISHPWRTYVAEQLQRGLVPAYNPYINFGHPLLANLQTGVFYPASCLFHLFHFTRALSPFLLLTYCLASGFGYLWLRRWGAARGAAAAGALVLAAGGTMIGYLQFPNLIAALAWTPALFLLTPCAAAAALASALAFYAGYPPVWAGMTGAWIALGAFWEGPRRAWGAAKATALALCLAAAGLLPGLAFARLTGRGSGGEGTSLKDRTAGALEAADLWSVARPEITKWVEARAYHGAPQVDQVTWTHDGVASTFTYTSSPWAEHVEDVTGIRYTPAISHYLGGLGALLALAGLALLCARKPAAGAAAGTYVALVLLVSMGSRTPVSKWLWAHAPYLSHLRGPSRMPFLLLAAAPPLIALGATMLARSGGTKGRRVVAALLAAGMALELGSMGWGDYPTDSPDYFTQAGPLVSFLRDHLQGLRYLIVPEVQAWPTMGKLQGTGVELFKKEVYRSYREKLFGISNVPFHLEGAGGSYEPLVFKPVEETLKELRAAERSPTLPDLLAWAGCRFALLRAELPPEQVGREAVVLPGRMLPRGEHLWYVYESPLADSRARWLGEADAPILEKTMEEAGAPRGKPWRFERLREDRFRVAGDAPREGRLYVAESALPGWSAHLGDGRPGIERAFGAFMNVRVPAGTMSVDFVYRAPGFLLGAAISVLALALLGVWGSWRIWTE